MGDQYFCNSFCGYDIAEYTGTFFPVNYVKQKWLWLSLLAYSFDWIFSFTMQIPIQLKLETAKDLELIEELLLTNWYRFAADTLQFLFVCIIVWQLLLREHFKKI